jgi:hypothetical protein
VQSKAVPQLHIKGIHRALRPTRDRGKETALLRNLLAGAGSGSQFIGGLVIALLYATIGVLGAAGSILVFRRIFQGRWEQIFWSSFLAAIAAFYLSFAAYFEAPADAWKTETVGVALFLVAALSGLFSPRVVATGYAIHGLWDLCHSLSGSSVLGLSLTEVPLGYEIFCATYDMVVASYLMTSDTAWGDSGKIDLQFWRERP